MLIIEKIIDFNSITTKKNEKRIKNIRIKFNKFDNIENNYGNTGNHLSSGFFYIEDDINNLINLKGLKIRYNVYERDGEEEREREKVIKNSSLLNAILSFVDMQHYIILLDNIFFYSNDKIKFIFHIPTENSIDLYTNVINFYDCFIKDIKSDSASFYIKNFFIKLEDKTTIIKFY